LARDITGIKIDINKAIIDITTNSSIKVNPVRWRLCLSNGVNPVRKVDLVGKTGSNPSEDSNLREDFIGFSNGVKPLTSVFFHINLCTTASPQSPNICSSSFIDNSRKERLTAELTTTNNELPTTNKHYTTFFRVFAMQISGGRPIIVPPHI
jgi:hypothetical protein